MSTQFDFRKNLIQMIDLVMLTRGSNPDAAEVSEQLDAKVKPYFRDPLTKEVWLKMYEKTCEVMLELSSAGNPIARRFVENNNRMLAQNN